MARRIQRRGAYTSRRLSNRGSGTINTRQRGGGAGNPIVRSSMNARQGEFIFQHNGQPYTGPYHVHQDGTYMIGAGTTGAIHDIKSNEVIVRTGGRRNTRSRYSGGSGGTPADPYRKRYHRRRRRIRDPYQGKGGSTGPNMGRGRPAMGRTSGTGGYYDPYVDGPVGGRQCLGSGACLPGCSGPPCGMPKGPGPKPRPTSMQFPNARTRARAGSGSSRRARLGSNNTQSNIQECLMSCGSTFEDGHVEYERDCMKNCTDKILW